MLGHFPSRAVLLSLLVCGPFAAPLHAATEQNQDADEKQAGQKQDADKQPAEEGKDKQQPVEEGKDTEQPVKVAVFGEAKLTVPADFQKIAPKSRIIQHEFSVTPPGAEGEDAPTARLTMMAAGGGVDANIARWKGQFGGDAKQVKKTERFKIGTFDVYVLSVSGSYADRMGGGPFFGGKTVQRQDYAMNGAILVDAKGRKFFVKMIGPQAVVQPNREKFVEMVKSVGK